MTDTTEDTLRRASNMGVDAAQVLENPAFIEAFTLMRQAITSAWAAVDMTDIEGQQLLLQQVKVVDRVRQTLDGMVERGKLADSKINTHGVGITAAAKRMLRQVY